MTDEFENAENGRCPICGKDTSETVCEHHLATFDLTFDGEGEFGIGLVGGALCNVTAIGDVFYAIDACFAEARMEGEQPVSAIPTWAKKVPELAEYLDALEDVDMDPANYENSDYFTSDLANNIPRRSEIMRSALSAWIDSSYLTVGGDTDYMGPGASSTMESWWCQTPEEVSKKLSTVLQTILGR